VRAFRVLLTIVINSDLLAIVPSRLAAAVDAAATPWLPSGSRRYGYAETLLPDFQ
jgi:hypothetical protein